MRSLITLLVGLVFLAGLMILLLPSERAEPGVRVLQATRFSQLAGWAEDDQAAALEAFLRSCARIDNAQARDHLGPYGSMAAWQNACSKARAVPPGATLAARQFFESVFVPIEVRAGSKRDGLFTGYYEPELLGSRVREGRFTVPLLARPADLVTVELGKFRESLKGERLAGRVQNGELVPYADRATLEAESLERPAVVYVDDPIAAFFLQIQGSGRVRLTDGTVIRVGFDGQNGHPYTPIGRVLLAQGALQKGHVTMQAIRDWLKAHPAQRTAVMNANASFVFFKERPPVTNPALGPVGAEGVPLTPGRSLAVDLSVHALGVPFYVVTAESPEGPLARLMIAQDTGGAIRGPVRGDIFWGFGPAAEAAAGAMQAKGRFYVLLPRAAADELAAAGEVRGYR